MKFSFSLILLLSFLVSCTTSQEQALETTLSFAGANRAELEKVLHHYKDESATKITVDRTEYDFGTFPHVGKPGMFFSHHQYRQFLADGSGRGHFLRMHEGGIRQASRSAGTDD